MNPIHKRRLLRLAAHLRTVPPKRFNMAYFGGRKEGCKTDGCAADHAADIALFRRQGYDCTSIPTFKLHCGAAAVKVFFGIDTDGYNRLFSYGNAPSTAKQVAKRIKEYVNER